jgi:bifunctional non-homologous end joining protein LigD
MPANDGRWRFEPKLDGWRVMVAVATGPRLEVRTRSGANITASVPELGALIDVMESVPAVFDGELVVGQGTPDDFYRLGGRLAATRQATVTRLVREEPVSVAMFDLLHLDGVDLQDRSYLERRSLLESLSLSDARWCTVSSHSGGSALFEACERLGLEGLVAKRVDSVYRPGRSRNWVKVKTAAWRAEHAPRRVAAGVHKAAGATSAFR